jgi:hypothetical protein
VAGVLDNVRAIDIDIDRLFGRVEDRIDTGTGADRVRIQQRLGQWFPFDVVKPTRGSRKTWTGEGLIERQHFPRSGRIWAESLLTVYPVAGHAVVNHIALELIGRIGREIAVAKLSAINACGHGERATAG